MSGDHSVNLVRSRDLVHILQPVLYFIDRCNRKFLLPEKNYSRSQNFPGKKDSRSNHFLGKYESPMEIITPLYFCRIYFLSDGSVFFPVNHYSSGAKYEVRSVRFAPHQNPDQIYWRSTLIFFYKYSKDI